MNANNEMEWTVKEVMTISKALFWHLSGGNKESHEPHPPTRTANLKVRTPNFIIQSTY
jgi:hypothetical protein